MSKVWMVPTCAMLRIRLVLEVHSSEGRDETPVG
jgi:hypothetical protein